MRNISDLQNNSDNNTPAISSYSLQGNTGASLETKISGQSITVTMPYKSDVTALIATFAGREITVNVGSTLQISGSSSNDFTSPITYTVTSANSKTTVNYIVTVIVAQDPATMLSNFALNDSSKKKVIGIPKCIAQACTITVIMPYATPKFTTLIPTFTTTGVVTVDGATVESGGEGI